MIPKEIERKFVFTNFNPGLLVSADSNIQLIQGYTVDGIRFTERVIGGNIDYRINYKTGAGLIRNEVNGPIGAEVFEAIWPLTEGRRVKKTRYHFRLGDMSKLELDVYAQAKIYPLITGEVEFDSEDAAINFDTALLAPFGSWFEATGLDKYANINLAC